MDEVSVWHDDGHVVHLRLERALLVIDAIDCPADVGEATECTHERLGCVVRFFVDAYGLDCHIGVCEPTPAMRIAWTMLGDRHDPEAAQVWVISTHDEAFAAWLVTQRG